MLPDDCVFVVLGPEAKGGVQEVNDALVAALKAQNRPFFYLQTHGAVRKFIRNNWPLSRQYVSIASLNFGVYNFFFQKSVFVLHGYPYRRHLSFFKYWVNVLGHALFGAFSNKVVAVSNLTKYVWENHIGLRVDSVIYNPYPVGVEDASRTVASFKINGDNSGIRNLVYVGRVVASKNLGQMLHAVDQLRQSSSYRINFHIVGTGKELASFQARFNHPDNIFYGFVDTEKKYKVFAGADAFISLNEGEPFGLTSLEAASFGLNCILATHGGHNEFVKRDRIFLVNDIKNISQISRQIEAALCNRKYESAVQHPSTHEPVHVLSRYISLFHEDFVGN
ncbi:Glycosyl transferases group 1 [Cnuella takakiae]|uniref:Glycosyl transferases group 1 n=1 Tax=Cnuella takakiae TaxID=1302690 RepID=A0A1M5B8W1_9BACT|nr:glycosyltransferase family 4 protein [Cnuella takakiae]OLY93383.1 hypothetical protein BUE76_16965 [Cnuella takakiae]SHF38919.1 Glycosyl transferases group 1 [Cnuella takakiae]